VRTSNAVWDWCKAPGKSDGVRHGFECALQTALEPASSVIGDKRVLVVADGALNYVPFEALVKTTEGADYASLNYLVKTNELSMRRPLQWSRRSGSRK
jgi:hypothetical protein